MLSHCWENAKNLYWDTFSAHCTHYYYCKLISVSSVWCLIVELWNVVKCWCGRCRRWQQRRRAGWKCFWNR